MTTKENRGFVVYKGGELGYFIYNEDDHLFILKDGYTSKTMQYFETEQEANEILHEFVACCNDADHITY